MFERILLASHGTQGAIAAENMAVQICARQATIDHLIVVPEFWQGMTGDDWLNNGVTRDQFREYLQSELGREVDQQCDRLNQKITAHGLTCNSIILFGKPDEALLHRTKAYAYDLLVMGSPRPGGMPGLRGLRSGMLTKKLTQAIPTTLLIVPYPSDE
ncbi:MAG TPA: universal stress protein [Nitrosomonas sp.]|nr:hypothetical protein [Nitrosomonas sp.]HNP26144.1 universal stress protein [Nitrosomonas sp.]